MKFNEIQIITTHFEENIPSSRLPPKRYKTSAPGPVSPSPFLVSPLVNVCLVKAGGLIVESTALSDHSLVDAL